MVHNDEVINEAQRSIKDIEDAITQAGLRQGFLVSLPNLPGGRLPNSACSHALCQAGSSLLVNGKDLQGLESPGPGQPGQQVRGPQGLREAASAQRAPTAWSPGTAGESLSGLRHWKRGARRRPRENFRDAVEEATGHACTAWIQLQPTGVESGASCAGALAPGAAALSLCDGVRLACFHIRQIFQLDFISGRYSSWSACYCIWSGAAFFKRNALFPEHCGGNDL